MYEACWGQWTPVCCFLLQDSGTEEPRATSIKTNRCVVDQASASHPGWSGMVAWQLQIAAKNLRIVILV